MQHTSPILYDPTKHTHLISQICEIHRACILLDHQILAFLPGSNGDVDTADLQRYWKAQCKPQHGVSRKEILLQMDVNGDDMLGIVIVDMPFVETGPFRCFIQKLMVCPTHRRQGIAFHLLEHAEKLAMENNKYLLMLDVPVGTPAERSRMYESAGYIEIGIIPKFGISPKDGSLVDEKFFYKDLRTLHSDLLMANTPDGTSPGDGN